MSRKKNKRKNKQFYTEEEEHCAQSVDPDRLRISMLSGAGNTLPTKFTFHEDVIDLHLHPFQIGPGKISQQEALYYQLQQFEKALDSAVAAGKPQLRVIHGLGRDILRKALYEVLKKHPCVREFQNDYHPLYGFGSTIIHFR
ncbi:MAG: Smr/MutS family protein [Chitinophagales bacterium]|nr:Smr/MutS family protein [Chitinophagales bacterium]MDW8420145.1 Smr/MutS family protein [Chitinophagales bacterium]